ncbi:MAG: hypothetical protein H6621_08650 [Halobacteriovoraceae bacterium]|nr:hypothetical protein [Halobacteriovoraceae bacterium]MCB9095122.1 hypothetical protein [Halobacteriovoraceae bacterium]
MRNIFLLTVFIFGLSSIYWWEEVHKKEQALMEDYQASLYPRIGWPVEYLEVGHLVAQKKDNHLFYGTIEIDEKNIVSYLELFKYIVLDEKLDKAPEGDLSWVLRIVINKESFEFSQANNLTGEFYLKISKGVTAEFYRAHSDKYFEGIYRNRAEKLMGSYGNLLRELSKTEKILGAESLLTMDVEQFVRQLSKGSEAIIDFKRTSTFPEAIDNLNYDQNKFQQLKKAIEDISIVDIVSDKNDRKMIATLSFLSGKQHKVFKLYQWDGKSFLKENNKDIFFQITDTAVESLFTPIKSLWGKKLPWIAKVDWFNTPLALEHDKKNYGFKVDKRLNFYFDGVVPNTEQTQALKELYCYLLFCSEQYGYFNVTQYTKNKFDKKQWYEFKVGDRSLYFRVENQYLNIVDPQSKIEMKYIWSMMQTGDVFKTLF